MRFYGASLVYFCFFTVLFEILTGLFCNILVQGLSKNAFGVSYVVVIKLFFDKAVF